MAFLSDEPDQNVVPEEVTRESIAIDILIGILLGLVFIVGNIAAPNTITIGLPPEILTTAAGQFWGSTILAPFAEEIIFRGGIYTILTLVLPAWVSGILQALIFSGAHAYYYGLGLQSAFIGAFSFGIATWLISKWRGSIIPAIILHIMFNLWLEGTKYAIFG